MDGLCSNMARYPLRGGEGGREGREGGRERGREREGGQDESKAVVR